MNAGGLFGGSCNHAARFGSFHAELPANSLVFRALLAAVALEIRPTLGVLRYGHYFHVEYGFRIGGIGLFAGGVFDFFS